MKSLTSIKPRLKKVSIIPAGNKLIIERDADGRAHQITLPAESQLLLDSLDGQNSIREIVEKLIAEKGAVNFRTLFTVLQLLDEGMFFTERIGIMAPKFNPATPLERPESFVMRPVFEVTLLRSLNLPYLKQPILLILAFLAIGIVSVDTCIYWIEHFTVRGFFNLRAESGIQSYAQAIPMFVLMASGLMVFKGLAKALLLLVTSGHIYRLRLRLHVFGVSIGVSDLSTQGVSGKLGLALYFLTCSMLYIFAAAVLPGLLSAHQVLYSVHSFEVLAVLFTFIDLDPYRRSDLTLIIDRFFKSDDIRHFSAYLKNRALLAVTGGRSDIQGELRLVVYSCLALLWTIGFGLFALDLLSLNYPNLILAIQNDQNAMMARVSAGVLLALLVAIFGNLFFDLLATIVSNVLFPMLTPYLKMLQKLRTTDVSSFDRDEVITSLKRISFFQDLSLESLNEVVSSSRLKNFKRGTRLIIQGQPGLELFALLSGSVKVLRREKTGLQSEICAMGPNSVFGEIALLKDCVRTADVVANEDIRALVVEKVAFQKLLTGAAASDYNRILDKIALGHYLASAPLFKDLPAESLGAFCESGVFEHHKAGAVVIEVGETDRCFYLVLRGMLDVTKMGHSVAALKQGDFFGEVALLSHRLRTATVTALEDCLLLKLESAVFWDVLSANLPLAVNLEMVAEQRLTLARALIS